MTNVQSVERISAILQMLATNPGGSGVTEIAHQIELPTSTVSRFLLALERVDYVERVSSPDGFRIGPGIFELATQASFPRFLVTLARPFLLDLAQSTGETVTLCLPERRQAHYIYQVPSQYHLQLQDWTGRCLPMHVASDGKVFLAYASPKRLDRYLQQPLEQFTANTVTEPGVLRQQLVQVRSQGFAWTQDEYEEGIIGLAAPIKNQNGQVVATVSIGAPKFRFPAHGEIDKAIRLILETGRKISEQLVGRRKP
jgi:DNA-binding IclR family transcriptional regulator